MKPARIIVLTIALVAAVAAGYLMLNISNQKAEQLIRIVKDVITDQVLVASNSLRIGSRLNEDNLDWQEWPENAVADGFITKSVRPDAIEELNGSIVRFPVFEGEPIRGEKVVDSDTRIMSSILPSGKRAVSTEISVETGAGGFFLPNDRVDVIMVRSNGEIGFLTETILTNIRVLAIDQRIQEDEEGNKTAMGTTATLELTPEQAQISAMVQQMAAYQTLTLRSVTDVQDPDTGGVSYLLSGDGGRPFN